MHFHCQKLTANDLDDFLQLMKLFERVFETPYPNKPAVNEYQKLLSKAEFICVVAKIDNEVVGGLSAYLMPDYQSERPLVYIRDLAVETAHQRNGIGKKLIETVQKYAFETHNVGEVFVLAEKADDYALKFYESTGAKQIEAIYYFYEL